MGPAAGVGPVLGLAREVALPGERLRAVLAAEEVVCGEHLGLEVAAWSLLELRGCGRGHTRGCEGEDARGTHFATSRAV